MKKDTTPGKGYLFVLEGVDGAGKTVVCKSVLQLLRNDHYDAVMLREPTNESQWGKEIRARSPKGELTPQEELELFIRDREWNIQNRIGPALAAGNIVLMDRYFFATGAYQTVSTGIPWQDILQRNRDEIHAPEPDVIFILDLDAEVGIERILAGRESLNQQFEKIDRLVKVRRAYLEMADQDSGNYVLVDASLPLDEVIPLVYQEILRVLRTAV